MLQTLDKIAHKSNPIRRIGSGFERFDQMLGKTTRSDGTVEWGMPRGSMIYFFGEPGVGKSRLMIQIMENLARQGLRSIVCQGEADLNAFAYWVSDKSKEVTSKITLTDDMDFADLMQNIREQKPDLVVVDSANMVNGISGAKDLKEKYRIWKQTVVEADCVCVLLGQLNQDGTLKGRTEVPHLVDVVGRLERVNVSDKTFEVRYKGQILTLQYVNAEMSRGLFRVSVPTKNRYGKSGYFCDFYHVEEGVKYLTSNLETHPLWLRYLVSEEAFGQAHYDSAVERGLISEQIFTRTKRQGFWENVEKFGKWLTR
ncbi:MAG: AAA family ATPase [Petrotogales bacterium]